MLVAVLRDDQASVLFAYCAEHRGRFGIIGGRRQASRPGKQLPRSVIGYTADEEWSVRALFILA